MAASDPGQRARADQAAPEPAAGADGVAQRLKLLSANIQAGSSTRRYSDYATRSWSHVLPTGKRTALDAIAALAAAPVDSYGVGTRLVTGSGAPTSSMVYKLVAREGADGQLVSVAKASSGKASVGGRKSALRRLDPRGTATHEIVGVGHDPADSGETA